MALSPSSILAPAANETDFLDVDFLGVIDAGLATSCVGLDFIELLSGDLVLLARFVGLLSDLETFSSPMVWNFLLFRGTKARTGVAGPGSEAFFSFRPSFFHAGT